MPETSTHASSIVRATHRITATFQDGTTDVVTAWLPPAVAHDIARGFSALSHVQSAEIENPDGSSIRFAEDGGTSPDPGHVYVLATSHQPDLSDPTVARISTHNVEIYFVDGAWQEMELRFQTHHASDVVKAMSHLDVVEEVVDIWPDGREITVRDGYRAPARRRNRT